MFRVVVAALAASMLCGSAQAVTYSYTIDAGNSPFSSTGTLSADLSSNGNYLITAITGAGITGLIVPGGYSGNDNILSFSAKQLLDFNGLSYTAQNSAGTFSVNILGSNGRYSGTANNNTGTISFFSPSFAVTAAPVAGAVPEPASWAMLIFGMSAIGYALRRRQSVRVSYAA